MKDFYKQTKEIRELIVDDRIIEVFRNLSFLIENFSFDKKINSEIILLHRDYLKISRESKLYGDNDNSRRQVNIIIRRVLDIINILEEENKLITGQFNKESSKRSGDEPRKESILNTHFPIVSIEEITKHYKGFELSPISLDLEVGKVTAIVGRNGSGKTTLLKIIAGKIKSNSGTINYHGFNCNGNFYCIKKKIGYVPQKIGNPGIDNLSWLKLSASTHGIRGDENALFVNDVILKMGLEDQLTKKWNEISAGYQLRITLASIMVWRPKLIILDEPLANLDIVAQKFLLATLKRYLNATKYPLSILITSQHIERIETIADNIVFLHEGEAKYNGKKNLLEKRFPFNIFQLKTNLNSNTLEEILEKKQFNYEIDIDEVGLVTIKIDKESSFRSLLNAIDDYGGKINFFQDISNSSLRFFI